MNTKDIQVTFDALDPRALSSFWRDALGYVHPGPPGVELPEGADPLAAWEDFLVRVGVPKEQHNTRSAIEDPTGRGPRIFFQQVPEEKVAKKTGCISTSVRLPGYRARSGWRRWRPSATGSSRWARSGYAVTSPHPR
nr:hypothetical protein GCM10020092_074480 [Actinoplanes digitatis]